MTHIRHVQPGHQPQPTIQLPVYTPPHIPAAWVLGKIYESVADGTIRLIEQRRVAYGQELAFFTNEIAGNIQYEVQVFNDQGIAVASKIGPAEHLEYLHSLHLNPI